MEDKLNDFGSLSKEDKKELLRRLTEDLGEEPGNLDRFGIEGEVTVRVLDDDGEQKAKETESFKY